MQLTTLESVGDYEGLKRIEQDFVISTVKVSEKDVPVMQVDPFPTQYQLKQLGKLVLIDRTRTYYARQVLRCRSFHGGQRADYPGRTI